MLDDMAPDVCTCAVPEPIFGNFTEAWYCLKCCGDLRVQLSGDASWSEVFEANVDPRAAS